MYLYSEEAPLLGLPVQCKVQRYLAVGDMPGKAAVLALAEPVYRARLSELVVLAKGNGVIDDVLDGTEVGVYVLPVDGRAGEEVLDIAGGLQPVIDWGALTNDAERAALLQVKPS